MALEQTTGDRGDEFSQALSLIFKLAKAAKAGDESAQLGLDYLMGVQLARNENLRLQVEVTKKNILIAALANNAAKIANMTND